MWGRGGGLGAGCVRFVWVAALPGGCLRSDMKADWPYHTGLEGPMWSALWAEWYRQPTSKFERTDDAVQTYPHEPDGAAATKRSIPSFDQVLQKCSCRAGGGVVNAWRLAPLFALG